MAKFVTALDTISGQVADVPEVYLTIEGFKDHLVQVEPGTKSYEPTKYKAQTADEWRAAHDKTAKPKQVDKDEPGEPALDPDFK